MAQPMWFKCPGTFRYTRRRDRLYPRERERASYGSEEFGPDGQTLHKSQFPEKAQAGVPQAAVGTVLEQSTLRYACCDRTIWWGGGDSPVWPTVEISDGAQLNSAPDQLHFLRLPQTRARREETSLWSLRYVKCGYIGYSPHG